MNTAIKLRNIASLYTEGFRKMTLGRTLWKVIFIKLFIIFGVIKFFFFPDFLQTTFSNDSERAAYVMDNMTHPPNMINSNLGGHKK